MTKRLFHVLMALIFASAATVCGLAHAEFQVPELTGRVVDAGDMFTEEEAQRIEQAILRLEEATGGQLVVATLPSLEGLPIEEVGIKLGDTWKIGHQGEDNGAILLFVVPERKMRLEIGRGWEGPINDARAGDVIRGLKPYFRTEKYTDGAIWAVEKVQEFVTGETVTESLVNPEVQEDVAHQLELTEGDEGEKEAEDHSWWSIARGVLVFLGLMAILLGACWQGLWLFGLLLVILWSVFVYIVLFPVVWVLFWPLRKIGIPLPEPKPSWFQSEWLLEFFELDSFSSGGSSSSDSRSSRSSSSHSSYSSSSHSSSSSHYSGGGGKFGGGGASGGW